MIETRQAPATQPLLRVEHLSTTFDMGNVSVRAVTDVSFDLYPGRVLGIVGESGSGKTTLGLAMLRLLSSQGRIVFQGEDIQGRSWRAMRPLRELDEDTACRRRRASLETVPAGASGTCPSKPGEMVCRTPGKPQSGPVFQGGGCGLRGAAESLGQRRGLFGPFAKQRDYTDRRCKVNACPRGFVRLARRGCAFVTGAL